MTYEGGGKTARVYKENLPSCMREGLLQSPNNIKAPWSLEQAKNSCAGSEPKRLCTALGHPDPNVWDAFCWRELTGDDQHSCLVAHLQQKGRRQSEILIHEQSTLRRRTTPTRTSKHSSLGSNNTGNPVTAFGTQFSSPVRTNAGRRTTLMLSVQTPNRSPCRYPKLPGSLRPRKL